MSEFGKVLLASFVLKEEAAQWWKATKTAHADQPRMEWARFKELFTEHYYPETYKFQMERDFINLKQGSMSVPEFVNEFTRLSRYAPLLV